MRFSIKNLRRYFLKSQGQCHLSFLLNDKKELMDNNQLIKVAQ